MNYLSLEPFVPSGNNFEGSKKLFQELGFTVTWGAGDYVGFENNGCRFVLQHYTNKEFAENFMLSVKIDDAAAFWQFVTEKNLAEKYGIRVSKPVKQPYGIEVNIIDIAGVCWHFVQ